MNKRNLIFAACIAACLAFSGCANPPPATTPATATTAVAVTTQVNQLQQVAATQCPIINGALATLTSLQGLPANTATALAAAAAANKTVCDDISTVNAASLQTLVKSVVPAILDAAKSAGLAAAQQNDIMLAVGAAQTVIQLVIAEQQVNAVPAAATTAK